MNTTSNQPQNPSPPGTSTPDPAAEIHLLDDVRYNLYEASGAKRFGNYLADNLIFYIIWRYLVGPWFVRLLVAMNFPTDDFFLLFLVGWLAGIVFNGFLIAGFESATGGKTIGKYLTRTRAVTEAGIPVGPKKAILRFLCRHVPFEPFSALGNPCYPWHDRWTRTLVIDEQTSTLPPSD